MLTIVFEDKGQEFREWDIQDGMVVECRPKQADIWVGTRVHTPIGGMRPGVRLEVTSRYRFERGRIIYPIAAVCSPNYSKRGAS